MRSASPRPKRLGAIALCGLLLASGLPGCATTQETAAKKRVQSERILERHEQKRKQREAKRKGKTG